MKGKSYVPNSFNHTQLRWHWNDGIYTFGNRNDIQEEQKSPRPWEELEEDQAKYVYVWKASVPEEWYKYKSPDEFVSVSQTGKCSTTLDFLGSTQKYIHQICHHKLKPINQPLIKPPKVIIGRTASITKTPLTSKISKTHRLTSSTTEPHLPKIPKRTERISLHVLPNLTRTFTEGNKDDELVLKTKPNLSHKDYLVTSYALPKGLSPLKKLKHQDPAKPYTNHEIDAFLGRFEKGQTPKEPPKLKTGMDGWKLAQIVSPRTKPKPHKSLAVPSKSTREFREGSPPTELYLEYLNYKKTTAPLN